HPRHIVAHFPLLLDTAPVDILDLRRRDIDALDQRVHQVRGKIVRAHIAVDPLLRMGPADRRTDGINDDGLTHGVMVPFSCRSGRRRRAARRKPAVDSLAIRTVWAARGSLARCTFTAGLRRAARHATHYSIVYCQLSGLPSR